MAYVIARESLYGAEIAEFSVIFDNFRPMLAYVLIKEQLGNLGTHS